MKKLPLFLLCAPLFAVSIPTVSNGFMEITGDRDAPTVRMEHTYYQRIDHVRLFYIPISWTQHFDRKAFTASIGVGYRHEFNTWKIGFNSFLDASNKLLDCDFQSTIGLEVLSNPIEFYLNAYRPWERGKVRCKANTYEFPMRMDAKLKIRVNETQDVFFQPSLSYKKSFQHVKMGFHHRINEWADISVYGGLDGESHALAGIVLNFGLYESRLLQFSPTHRTHHIRFAKKRKAARPVLPAPCPIIIIAQPEPAKLPPTTEPPQKGWFSNTVSYEK